MRGEFIYSTKGAYTLLKDSTGLRVGEASTYYGDLDFSKVANCQKQWKISGVLNPDYKWGADSCKPDGFPDRSGFMAESLALASWQYLRLRVPHAATCDAMHRLCFCPRGLLVPFQTDRQGKGMGEIKRLPLPNRAPAVATTVASASVASIPDYKSGWTARITLFNWGGLHFQGLVRGDPDEEKHLCRV
ncbi:hypothetical protein HPP92_009878 [Vanilla planifolia]|uniref:Uncharacterized protein n=1 Tax=Vanilla planifolia TaxID=51239 RepID=A0A835UZK1_VANPL|nr:hypothetical protein HPP92_009878 [Vanilla planifolia]